MGLHAQDHRLLRLDTPLRNDGLIPLSATGDDVSGEPVFTAATLVGSPLIRTGAN